MRVLDVEASPVPRDRHHLALDRHHFDVILLPVELHIDAIKRDLVNVVAALGDEPRPLNGARRAGGRGARRAVATPRGRGGAVAPTSADRPALRGRTLLE